MNTQQIDEKAVFNAARRIADATERDDYLAQACGDDNTAIQRIRELLRIHEQEQSFLESPAAGLAATIDSRPITERPGTIIGPYKLLQQIGEGGMGVVFMAEQTEPIQRTVALKIIKPGMDTRQVIARFEAERQAVAMMDHPNIAKVLDAGTTDSGRPYFVMELVKGVPITKYCDEKRLPIRARLELFMQVCQAVQHAHQKGIIHRDIKPNNVLVAEYDHQTVPKVIDFGVAKATAQKLTERTMFTEFGQVLGTMEYMSPEQSKFNQLDIDTRSDIYSLGVLLYELLAGSTPFEGKRLHAAAFDEMLRIIREEEPPRPSTRFTTLALQAASTIAVQRGSDRQELTVLLRGELDWIVMKSLEKDRNRRYETASALAADVLHHLHDEPVQACPPSARYRLGKFAKRHKAAFVTGSAIAAAVIVAVGSLISGVFVLAASNARTQQVLESEKETSYVQRIALAGRELNAGNVGRAEELLDECPRERRGWEWYFLKRQRYGNPSSMKYEDTIVRVAFSPDGRQIASVCMQGAIEIRDARTGKPLHTLEPQTVLVGGALCRGLAYSRDSRYLAIARHDGVIRVWDAASGQLLHTLEGHNGPSWQVAFSPDNRTLASAGSDRSVRLWDVTSGQALQVFSAHPAPVKGVAFLPNGRSVVAACEDGTVKVWDRDTARQTFSFHGELLAYPYSAWFSPDGRRLAWSCMDGMIKIWNTTTGRLEIDQQSNTQQCRAVAFSPDGRRIALAGFDGTLRLLDAVTGREMLTIFAHPSLVADAAFSPDGRRLASASYDHTVRLWDASPLTSDPLAPHCVTLTGHNDKVAGVAFSPDGHWLGSASWDYTVKLWEKSASNRPGKFTLRRTLRGHDANVVGVAFSSDKRMVASGSWDKSIKLWDLQTAMGDSLSEPRTIRCAERVSSIAISPDGQLLAVGQMNGIAIYDPATGKETAPFKRTQSPVPAVAFSPDSRRLVSAGASDPAIKVWDVSGQEPLFEIRHNSNPNASVAVSLDGGLIASPGRDQAAGDHTVKVWEVDWVAKTYKEFRTLKGHAGYVWKVAFSPEGRYLASGSWDSTVKVWDLEAPESAEPVTLRGHAGFIQSLAFNPDGRRLASGSGYAGHGEIIVWDATLWDNARGQR
jgi:WD40 repeat protein/serine/threonine protein kinase